MFVFFSWLFLSDNIIQSARPGRPFRNKIKGFHPSLKGSFTSLALLLAFCWTSGWIMTTMLIANRITASPSVCVCSHGCHRRRWCFVFAHYWLLSSLRLHTLSTIGQHGRHATASIQRWPLSNQFTIVLYSVFLPHDFTHLCVPPPLPFPPSIVFCFLPAVLICWSHYGTLCPAVIVDANDIRGSVVWRGVSRCAYMISFLENGCLSGTPVSLHGPRAVSSTARCVQWRSVVVQPSREFNRWRRCMVGHVSLPSSSFYAVTQSKYSFLSVPH